MEKTIIEENSIMTEVGKKIPMLCGLRQRSNERVDSRLSFFVNSLQEVFLRALKFENSFKNDDYATTLKLDLPSYEIEGVLLCMDTLTRTPLIYEVDEDVLNMLNEYYAIFNFLCWKMSFYSCAAKVYMAKMKIDECSENIKMRNHALELLNIAHERCMDAFNNIVVHDYKKVEHDVAMCIEYIEQALDMINLSIFDLFE